MNTLPIKKNLTAAKYIDQALKEHHMAVQAFRNCKEHALKCGFFFKAAQESARMTFTAEA